jgi:NAD(P)-dependent dehydrogenase (short-subunit alcohol dehydrogenase family)
MTDRTRVGLDGKVAVVTGAAAGLGQAFAQRLAEEGADIVLVDKVSCDATAALIDATARRAVSVTCDISQEDGIEQVRARTAERFGRCDILVNNAGIYPRQPFEDVTFADWRRVMSVNLDAVFLLCRAFVPEMKAKGWGRVVNLSSSTLNTVTSGFTHYIASKGGVMGLTRALASELGNSGVTVNAIAPSLTRTPGTRSQPLRPGSASLDEDFENFARRQAIQRVQEVGDLLGTLSYLVGDGAAFVTGQVIHVDGGMVRV